MTRQQVERQQECRDKLRGIVKPGDIVYTTLRHVSRSGMSRVIDCHVIQDGQPRWIGRLVADAIGMRYDDKAQGVRAGGCGMDMGFHVVYELSARLWPDGFGCIGKDCPSNDHSNGDRDYTPHDEHVQDNPEHICATSPETCTGHTHWHGSGGYALRQRWI